MEGGRLEKCLFIVGMTVDNGLLFFDGLFDSIVCDDVLGANESAPKLGIDIEVVVCVSMEKNLLSEGHCRCEYISMVKSPDKVLGGDRDPHISNLDWHEEGYLSARHEMDHIVAFVDEDNSQFLSIVTLHQTREDFNAMFHKGLWSGHNTSTDARREVDLEARRNSNLLAWLKETRVADTQGQGDILWVVLGCRVEIRNG